jgi:hypothetical protein
MIQDIFDPEYYVGLYYEVDEKTGNKVHHIPTLNNWETKKMTKFIWYDLSYLGVFKRHYVVENTAMCLPQLYESKMKNRLLLLLIWTSSSSSYEQEGFKLQLDEKETKTFDRTPLYCVPIPAETQWAKDIVFYFHSSTFRISCFYKYQISFDLWLFFDSIVTKQSVILSLRRRIKSIRKRMKKMKNW